MKKILFGAMLCFVLAACGKEEAAPEAAAPATTPAAAPVVESAPAVAASAETAVVETASVGTLPAACEDYFKRAEACFAKGGAAAEQMKGAFDQARTQMMAYSAEQLEMGCKASNDAFAQTAAALKCE